MAEWVERMRDRDVPEVARALGLDYAPPKGSSGGSFPCPACNAAKRHTKSGDKRGAAGVRRAGDGWRCFQCDVSGDVLDLVSWVEAGGPLASCGDEDKARVRTWCLDFLGLTDTPFVPRKRAPAPMRFDPLPSYPPVDEVGAVWSAAQPVTSDAGVVRWMEHERPEHAGQVEVRHGAGIHARVAVLGAFVFHPSQRSPSPRTLASCDGWITNAPSTATRAWMPAP